jgi:enoyl-CoA hydratase/carnithine racemase
MNPLRHLQLAYAPVATIATTRCVPQPVIAKVYGVATAAGCQVVAACDLAVAADDAQEGICAFLEKRRPSWKGS